MDILTVLTIFSTTICLLVVLRAGRQPRNWSPFALVGLVSGVVGYLVHVVWIQVFACTTTILFLLIPGLLMARVRRMLQHGQFRKAYTLSLKIPVPRRRWGPIWHLWPILAELYEGNRGPAEAELAEYASSDDPLDLIKYETLLVHLTPFKDIQLLRDPLLQARLCLEHGRVDEGIELFAHVMPRKVSWLNIRAYRQNIIAPICYGGLVKEAHQLIERTRLPIGIGAAWIATAKAAAGNTAEAIADLNDILQRPDPTGMGHNMARIRLNNLPSPPDLNQSALDALDVFRREAVSASILSPGRPREFPSLLLALVGLSLFYGYQAAMGGLQDSEVIWRMGALVPNGSWPAEPWRLINYGLLHGGLIHLLTNLFSLAVVGPFILRALGAAGFWFVFVGGIILAGIGISFFGQHQLTIGASGGVMALMAALIPICLMHPQVKGSLTARGFLNLVLTVCVLQTAIDISNAVISFAGHFSGLFAGGFLGTFVLLVRGDKSEDLNEVR